MQTEIILTFTLSIVSLLTGVIHSIIHYKKNKRNILKNNLLHGRVN